MTMKKTYYLFAALLLSFPLLSQNYLWGNYPVETVLAMAELPVMDEDFYVVDSLYCSQFDEEMMENPVSRQYNLDFTSEGAVLESISQNYNSELAEWQNNRRELYTYDGAGNVFEQVGQAWDEGGQNWQNDTRQVNTWNAESDLEETLNQRWHLAGNNWRNFEKLIFGYDADGFISSFEQELWDTVAVDWKKSFRILYAVNGEGQVVSTLFQLWQDGDFNSLSRTFHEFDGELETGITTEVWNMADEIWVNSSRKTKAHDSNGNLTTETDQIWIVQDSTWQNQNRILQNFNAEGDVTLRTQLTWGNDQWVNFFQTMNSYDTVANLVRFEVAQWQINEWVPLNSCDFYWRFSHEFVAVAEAGFEACSLPNPYRLGTSVECANLPEGEKKALNLFDLSGKLVHTENLDNQNFINIAGPLNEGMYVLVIRGEKGVLLAQKLMVRGEE